MQRAGSILSLFAAEEIPAAMITFVSLLLFLQTGTSVGLSVCYSALLFLPWVFKSFMRDKVRRVGRFRRALQGSEFLLACCFVLLGMALNPSNDMFCVVGLSMGNGGGIFVLLFLISLLTAWHELAARMYYERMLRPQLQRMYNGPKMFISQLMVVATYGLLIIFVGTLQVLYRSIFVAWSRGMFLTALVLSAFFFYHLYSLKVCPVGDHARDSSMVHAVKKELHILERIRKRPRWYLIVLQLFLLMLPQALMFYTRVPFFLSPVIEGGLGRSIQDVGFAQGVIGALAFCLGISIGRRYMHYFPQLCFVLTLSPFVYLVMVYHQNWALWQLSIATFLAQFCFGFGQNACHEFVREISGERYRNTINFLYVPLVASVMILPMIMSGWMIGWLGYKWFFLIDVCCAPLAWISVYLLNRMK